ncbi:LOW QUALITY PROTEIN: protein phosphatase 1 regulatory subunit 12C [Poecile atricapillus]|uniref:LOW QUALITY PROTEIN: protein phosphatase 1 regulatory subunit 12C n=1 Tax=Poecile atricapillus TaxID=48891 RepID=UPI0027382207|nr:LOW QUALITY PROTEIN: protein phosphatase 1 regulatory subunit 12C [Poecile atricapillus]
MAAAAAAAAARERRREQLRRWEEAAAAAPAPREERPGPARVRFERQAEFRAVCAGAELAEARAMVMAPEGGGRALLGGANADGISALHQACIDENMEVVQFLVESGADVNQADNEGWTPLHVAAACGCRHIAQYLLDHGADAAAVTSDLELPLEVAEDEALEELLRAELQRRGVDVTAAKRAEEERMLRDTRLWLDSGQLRDCPHPATGASALHVAAAKGYIEVMRLLLAAGYDPDVRDKDGWTPLHAAAHWGVEEACRLLCEHLCDMSPQNNVGQRPCDLADEETLPLLEELQRRQHHLRSQKDPGAPPPPPAPEPSGAPPAVGGGRHRRSSVCRRSSREKLGPLKSPFLPRFYPVFCHFFTVFSPNFGFFPKIPVFHPKSGFSPPGARSSVCRRSSREKLSLQARDRVGEGALPPSPYPSSPRVGEGKPRATRGGGSDGEPPPGDPPEAPPPNGPSPPLPAPPPVRRSSSSPRLQAPPTGPPRDPPEQRLRRPFQPPKARDEESESQRKARSRLMRQARRATQGVTLTELRAAEQGIGRAAEGRGQEQPIRDEGRRDPADPPRLPAPPAPPRAGDQRAGAAAAPGGGGACPRAQRATGPRTPLPHPSGSPLPPPQPPPLPHSRAPAPPNGLRPPPAPPFDYQQLFQELWEENERIREQLQEAELALTQSRLELERVTQRQERSAERPARLELERFERRALELKAAELEEELKALSDLRADNQRLKDENAALIRVISKLSK